jgi:hypothetical protein
LRQSQWQPAILEGESPGDIPDNARKRDWLPGQCGLLPRPALAHFEQGAGKDRWPPQRLRVCDRKMTNRQLALANAAVLSSAAGLKRHSAVTR